MQGMLEQNSAELLLGNRPLTKELVAQYTETCQKAVEFAKMNLALRQDQSREEILQFSDIILDYKNDVDAVKVRKGGFTLTRMIVQGLMNNRTEVLIDCDAAFKKKYAKQAEVAKIKARFGENNASLPIRQASMEQSAVCGVYS